MWKNVQLVSSGIQTNDLPNIPKSPKSKTLPLSDNNACEKVSEK